MSSKSYFENRMWILWALQGDWTISSSRGKIETALSIINSNRLTDLFLRNKAVKTRFVVFKSKKCRLSAIECRLSFLFSR